MEGEQKRKKMEKKISHSQQIPSQNICHNLFFFSPSIFLLSLSLSLSRIAISFFLSPLIFSSISFARSQTIFSLRLTDTPTWHKNNEDRERERENTSCTETHEHHVRKFASFSSFFLFFLSFSLSLHFFLPPFTISLSITLTTDSVQVYWVENGNQRIYYRKKQFSLLFWK